MSNARGTRMFTFQLGFLFEEERSKTEIDGIFQKLNSIDTFDGLKKISNQDGEAILASSDDSVELNLTERDIVISYTNVKLKRSIDGKYSEISDLALQVYSFISDIKIQAVKFTETVYVTSKTDRMHFANEILNPKNVDKAADYDVSLVFSDEVGADDDDLYRSVNIATSHTNGIHKVFAKNKKLELLDSAVFLRSAVGMGELLTNSQVMKFIKDNSNANATHFTLKKLRYGQE